MPQQQPVVRKVQRWELGIPNTQTQQQQGSSAVNQSASSRFFQIWFDRRDWTSRGVLSKTSTLSSTSLHAQTAVQSVQSTFFLAALAPVVFHPFRTFAERWLLEHLFNQSQ